MFRLLNPETVERWDQGSAGDSSHTTGSLSGSMSGSVSTNESEPAGDILLLERKSIQPYRSQDEYIWAMKEDLADWLNTLYSMDILPETLLDELETGVLLCKHATKVSDLMGINRRLPYRLNAQPGSFHSRDNLANFLAWCTFIGIPDDLRFESDDLVERKNERHVILCMLEVARRGARYGMLAPQIVLLEQEIEEELAGGQQCQQITYNLKSLDELVREMVSQCTCPSLFPMIRISDGRYQVGDSRTAVFVRILRNHVMVRIGGGWDTLQNYLNRHDPCRCHNKGQHGTSGSKPAQRSVIQSVIKSYEPAKKSVENSSSVIQRPWSAQPIRQLPNIPVPEPMDRNDVLYVSRDNSGHHHLNGTSPTQPTVNILPNKPRISSQRSFDSSINNWLEGSEPGTPPEDEALNKKLERLFEAFKRTELNQRRASDIGIGRRATTPNPRMNITTRPYTPKTAHRQLPPAPVKAFPVPTSKDTSNTARTSRNSIRTPARSQTPTPTKSQTVSSHPARSQTPNPMRSHTQTTTHVRSQTPNPVRSQSPNPVRRPATGAARSQTPTFARRLSTSSDFLGGSMDSRRSSLQSGHMTVKPLNVATPIRKNSLSSNALARKNSVSNSTLARKNSVSTRPSTPGMSNVNLSRSMSDIWKTTPKQVKTLQLRPGSAPPKRPEVAVVPQCKARPRKDERPGLPRTKIPIPIGDGQVLKRCDSGVDIGVFISDSTEGI